MLSAVGIRKKFGALEVLRGIDLDVQEGESVSIIGASGAGKTTLLQIIGTLDTEYEGALEIEGTPIHRLKADALATFRNRHIGFVFQFHQLLPEFTALENVMIPALIAKRSRKEAEKEATVLLERLGLETRLQHKPMELSGGEKQRVAVARALINRPRLLLADEPSGSLDSANKQALHELLWQLRREFALTMLIVTHDPALAEICDRCIRMKDGLIV